MLIFQCRGRGREYEGSSKNDFLKEFCPTQLTRWYFLIGLNSTDWSFARYWYNWVNCKYDVFDNDLLMMLNVVRRGGGNTLYHWLTKNCATCIFPLFTRTSIREKLYSLNQTQIVPTYFRNNTTFTSQTRRPWNSPQFPQQIATFGAGCKAINNMYSSSIDTRLTMRQMKPNACYSYGLSDYSSF